MAHPGLLIGQSRIASVPKLKTVGEKRAFGMIIAIMRCLILRLLRF